MTPLHPSLSESASRPSADELLAGLWQRLVSMQAAQRVRLPDYAQRMDDLARLRVALRDRLDAFADAAHADFGQRSRHETLLADGMTVLSEIDHTRAHLREWMRPERVPTSAMHWPGRNEVRKLPLGVVGVLSPWNYPVNLALIPLVGAIGAGNHVLLKPSEHVPRTAALLKDLIASVFPSERADVVLGDASVAQAFASLPFDHLFFTGSTDVGRKVMAAAAANLVPVTLELGGKSPAFVSRNCDLEEAARRIAQGKCFNGGQTCIAADYLLVEGDRIEELVAALKRSVAAYFPQGSKAPDLTSMVSVAQFERLRTWLAEAKAAGARLVEIGPGDAARRVLPLTVVIDAPEDTEVMRSELFGPVLPLVRVADAAAAIDYVNARPHPLALYLFERDARRIEEFLARTTVGSAAINDTLVQFAQRGLPFGGVGASGLGQYHGRYSFETFSRRLPIFRQPAAFGTTRFARPPYRRLADWLVRLTVR